MAYRESSYNSIKIDIRLCSMVDMLHNFFLYGRKFGRLKRVTRCHQIKRDRLLSGTQGRLRIIIRIQIQTIPFIEVDSADGKLSFG